jgi:2-desacetyl-2-hydroxyethyl bacteriochlorophyllide A dehydrogenase
MKILGQDTISLWNQICALVANIISWVTFFLPKFFLPVKSLPKSSQVCISISGPGGLDKLKYIDFPNGAVATVGYNVSGFKSPFVTSLRNIPKDCVLVKTSYFSVNYADVTIRWGLYESALRHVGWPIVPGFDFAGEVILAGTDCDLKEGDLVFGFTLFGAYSSRILVPSSQIRKIPSKISPSITAALPAVAGTALHAISLAGAWPQPIMTKCKAVLIHSAAGGVGSMLIQMCKLVGLSPVVAVVGSKHKVNVCLSLGADFVIDKSSSDLWPQAEKISKQGYIAIFDANGVDTLYDSYSHLCRCGRLIVYGFHSNLPKATQLLSPLHWLKMIAGLALMPKFDAMPMVLESKGILGFNLSFFADEHALIEVYMNQILDWLNADKLRMADVTIFDMACIGEAHNLIQTGMSVGKIVIKCPK